MFEKASREKLRISTQVGNIAIEDLWDLPLVAEGKVSLDGIAKVLNKRIRDMEDEDISFVNQETGKDPLVSKEKELLQLRFDIVRHIIDVLVKERDAQKKKLELDMERKKYEEALALQDEAVLKDLSRDELIGRINALKSSAQ